MIVDYINFYHTEKRAEYIYDKFQNYFGQKMLDVGCNQAILKTLIDYIEYVGIDISGKPDICLDLEEINSLPFEDSTFDCVICSDVLEHVDNLHLVFSELIRVSRKYVIISWPNCWVNARVPIERGHGSFKYYGLPVEKPQDRHKWFFCYSDAKHFTQGQIDKNNSFQLVEERVTEKPKFPLFRFLRHLRYPKHENYLNRYAHTYWVVLQKAIA